MFFFALSRRSGNPIRTRFSATDGRSLDDPIADVDADDLTTRVGGRVIEAHIVLVRAAAKLDKPDVLLLQAHVGETLVHEQPCGGARMNKSREKQRDHSDENEEATDQQRQ